MDHESVRESDDEALFDLPLRPQDEDSVTDGSEESGSSSSTRSADSAASSVEGASSATEQGTDGLLLFDDPVAQAQPVAATDPQAVTRERTEPSLLRLRLEAGLIDLGVLALLVALPSVVAAAATAADLGLLDLLSLGVVGLILSFISEVIPLLVWGQTLGMGWRGIRAQAPDQNSPSLGQAVRRWVGGWITRLGFGLPGLARLADWTSDTKTVRVAVEVQAEPEASA